MEIAISIPYTGLQSKHFAEMNPESSDILSFHYIDASTSDEPILTIRNEK